MKHRVAGRKLNRTSAHRKAMFANMMASLVMHDRIETTLPKAKELKPLAERLITLGKQKTLHARRRAVAIVRDKTAVKKVFDELAVRFEGRDGGYTRIYKLGCRQGDSAPMAVIEYLPSEEKVSADDSDKKKSSKKAAPKKDKKDEKPAKKAAAAKKALTKKTDKDADVKGKKAAKKK
jgi:large subunit ribosomal protein L17